MLFNGKDASFCSAGENITFVAEPISFLFRFTEKNFKKPKKIIMSEDTAIKSITELQGFHFLVEDYQRGYKWTETEVEQLLNDINEFSGNANEFYCLQPVVVKKVIEDGENKIELIDGQQRITTIYIILSYLSKEEYKIDYRTRESSAKFLENIMVEHSNHDNIDNYHFSNAYESIKKWFENKLDIDRNTFYEKLTKQVKVIWYEVPENSKQESIKIFTRINSGKIPLTNAELIKALFLINVQNDKNAEILQLKQNEIAQQWDNIEYTLQDNAFWYFISNDKPTATRIDFIFDLIADKNKNEKDKYSTFLSYNESFAKESNKQTWVENEWQKVRNTFQTLQEWYENRELYHLIGFLITSKICTIDVLIKHKNDNKLSKTDFIKFIKVKIKENIKDIKLDDLSYEEQKDKDKINKILLLYNIQTEIDNKTANSKYPFNLHKAEKWSLEHIHAQKEEGLKSEAEICNYILGFKKYIKIGFNTDITIEFLKTQKEIIDCVENQKISKTFDDLKKMFELFIQEAKNTFPELFDLHSLDNMALLPIQLNSSLSNDFFNEKRNKIIEFEKDGKFIPICTRNVFLKYYSEDSNTNLFYWSEKDRENYLQNIKTKLKPFIS